MIDIRSDTVTRPSPEMLATMVAAETGDDVYGEDATLNQLESYVAEITAKEAALFVSSGTQSNLLALLSHCQRGDEYIAGQDAHAYRYEAGGAAVLGGIQPQPLPFNERGELDLDEVKRVVKPNDFHFAQTRLVCLENTQGGKVLQMSYLQAYSDLMKQLNLKAHLDGARLFNAVVKLAVTPASICAHFDTVSICLSKSLGCPVGSVLVGDAETIAKARRWRKMLGGGMRQAGILAAAGLYALEHNIDRLKEDHQNADKLGNAIQDLGFKLKEPVETNMVILDLTPDIENNLRRFLRQKGILMSSPRWVIHKDVSALDITSIIEACKLYSAKGF